MNADGKSDERVVPKNPANNGGQAGPPAESAEGRRATKRNTGQSNLPCTQRQNRRRSSGLDGVRDAARKDRELKFTSLLHHVSVDLLRRSFYRLKRKAAVGVDEVSWQGYEQDLENNLIDLHGRIHRGAFRAKPSRRVYIDKADGSRRPLGIPSLEDKIVQHAVRHVMQHIYEEDFKGFSYGFRPRRSPHQALDAVSVGITEQRVNWIIDADIKGFFDEIDRDWLVKFIEHRISDKRLVRLIQRWLNAGIIEETDWSDSGKGTPQGGILSPLLANIFLHYVLDLWFDWWRRRRRGGKCIIIRYADDFVLGFEDETDARECLGALSERMAKFGLQLHPTKTRLIEFGRRSAGRNRRDGRKSETFDFLGLTHFWGTTRSGQITLQRRTMAKRLRRKLTELGEELRRRRHDPVGATGRWLASVVRGWQNYYGVPMNYRCLQQFQEGIFHLWLRQLRRRSQRGRSRWTYARMRRLVDRHLPKPRITHPWPHLRFRARLRVGAV